MTNTRSFWLSELDKVPEQRWMIPNVIPEQGLAMIYGPPGAGKTFVALDIGLSLAHGLEWTGKTGVCRKQYRVAFFAGEALTGVAKRIRGWHEFHHLGFENKYFALFNGVPAIGTKDGRDQLSVWVHNHWESPPELYIIDTAMCASGGIDLNTPSGSQALFDGCNIIRRHSRASVLLLHHTGKNKARGPLGAENIKAALDNLECIQQGPETNGVKTVKLIQEKNKDGELRGEVRLSLKSVDVPSRTEGINHTTLVAAPVPVISGSNLPLEGDILVRIAKDVLDGFPGRAFRVRTLASAVWRQVQKRGLGKKFALGSRKVEDKLRGAARRGEFGRYAHKEGSSNNSPWRFKSNDNLDDI